MALNATRKSTLSNGNGNGDSAFLSGNSNGNGALAAKHHFATRLIHVGSDASEETGAVQPAISLSTTFKQQSVGVHKV